jgi:hypothetical protein
MSEASDFYAQTLPQTCAPRREQSPQFAEAASLALELVNDLCDPEAYGHAVPVELLKRAGRIRAMLRPAGVGFTAPPPARCEFCDSA